MLLHPTSSASIQRRYHQARVPLIYVSHNAAEIKRIASRVVRLDSGQVVETGGIELLDGVRADMLA